MLKRRTLIVSLLLLALIAGSDTSAKISVSPLSAGFNLVPGESVTGSFLVKNIGEQLQQVTVSMRDYARSLAGEDQFLPANTIPQSLTRYVDFSPATFELEPGAVQEVQFQVTLPVEETGPHWMMFLVEESKPEIETGVGVEGAGGGFAFNVNIAFAVRIRQSNPDNVVADGRVTGVVVAPAADEPLAVQMTFENTGTAYLSPRGRVEIRDRTGQTVASTPINEFPVLPGAKRILDVVVTTPLASGKYIALGIIDFGGDFLVAGQAFFEIP